MNKNKYSSDMKNTKRIRLISQQMEESLKSLKKGVEDGDRNARTIVSDLGKIASLNSKINELLN